MTIYVYTADIHDWTVDHPEVMSRIPSGYVICNIGFDGVWIKPSDELAAIKITS